MREDSEWQRKGGTLTGGTAQDEYGLTRADIARAIRAGKLSCRDASIYGNPCLRLLRREVEAFVEEQRGRNYLNDRRVKMELASINREIRRLRKELATLEKRKSELVAGTRGESPIQPGSGGSQKRHDRGGAERPNKEAAGASHRGGIR